LLRTIRTGVQVYSTVGVCVYVCRYCTRRTTDRPCRLL